MFKSARWRSEKNKVKSVFKLQFHATQVLQAGVDSLTLSVIPVDVGKPSVKLEKASVKDGGCRWENSVNETVKFSRDPKTGKISEKIYRFSVGNGSAKNVVLGEVSIDFAAYAEASKASTVSLPLKNSSTDSILHVLIQRIQENADQREVEECDDIKPNPRDRSLQTHMSHGHIDDILAIDGQINKTTNHNGEMNGNHRASSGSDITFSSSDSSSGVNTPRELGLRNGDAHPKKVAHASMAVDDHCRSQWKWSGGSDHGVGTDDSTQGSGDALTRESSQPATDVEIEKLKAELGILVGQANVSELELQTLRKQIIKESKRAVDLSKEVGSLKEERDAYKEECERLKSFQKLTNDAKNNNRLSWEGGDLRTLVEEIGQELTHEKDLNSNLRLQLQKTQEANAELILAVQDLEEMLEQKNKEFADQINQSELSEDGMKRREGIGKYDSDEDEEQKALEKLVKEHRDANETLLLEQKITDLYNEIEIYRRDRDELEMQMEQLALDYEILKQENHDISYKLEQSQIQEQLKMQYECSPINELASHIEGLEKELKTQSEELSNSLATIKELESHIKSLEEQLKMRLKEKTDSLVTVKDLESHITSLNEELKIRANESSDFSVKIKELKSHITSLEEELKIRAKESYDSSVTIKELESHIERSHEEMKERSKESSEASETMIELKSQNRSLEEELKTRSEELSKSLVTIKALESHIEGLDEELKKWSKESSNSLVTIKDLEFHIKSLEEELDERTHVFEADLEALMVAKVEQEQRAIRAEESMRKMRWKNASTAEKLQDEFKRLSAQMASTFEANEKVAMKSIQEASELRAQKSQLEEMLLKSMEELQVVSDGYEAKLQKLSSQIVVKTTQIQHMSLETNSNAEDKLKENLSQEILGLKAEIEKLKTEKNRSLIAELEDLKKSVKENEMLIEKGNIERNELMKNIELLKKEAESSMEELNRIKNLKDDKAATVERLQSELEKLEAQCESLKNSLSEDEVEKENLRKQVFQLKNDLKKKEDAISSVEKKIRDSNGRTTISDGTKTSPKNNKPAAAIPRGPKEVNGLREKIKLLEGQIKSKETALENSTATFLEKEKDLQNKIEDLETRLEELNQNSAFQKVVKDDEASSPKREENASEEGDETRSPDDKEIKLEAELALLQENNQFMEGELKEMQERYSEISLKFAEVEGERQKLVMTVRYLKNNRKN